MNNQTSSEYIHGTDPEEQARLSLLNDLLNIGSLRELQLQGGERLLEVGCGLGQLSRAMARVTGVRVIGIERSAEQIAEAERQAAETSETAQNRTVFFTIRRSPFGRALGAVMPENIMCSYQLSVVSFPFDSPFPIPDQCSSCAVAPAT